MSNRTIPTFATDKDRLTYLVSEYRIPLSVMVLAAAIWMTVATPQIPSIPAPVLSFSAAWGLLALPSFILCKKVVSWLYTPKWVHVGIAIPGESIIYDGKKVPPDVWAEATVDGPSPLRVDDGMYDYVVTAWEWLDDVGELTVRGCDRAEMTPDEAFQDATKVEEYYDKHHKMRRAYSRLKARKQKMGTEIHDQTIINQISQLEEAVTAPGVDISGVIEEAESDEEEVDQFVEDFEADDFEDELVDPLVGPQPAEAAATDGGRDE